MTSSETWVILHPRHTHMCLYYVVLHAWYSHVVTHHTHMYFLFTSIHFFIHSNNVVFCSYNMHSWKGSLKLNTGK